MSIGVQIPGGGRDAFQEFVDRLAYPCVDETDNWYEGTWSFLSFMETGRATPRRAEGKARLTRCLALRILAPGRTEGHRQLQ